MVAALIVVDMQNDFADPGGSLFVAGGDQIVGAINTEQGRVRDAGGEVVYTQDWHPPETPHFAPFGGVWPVHCVRETWGAALHPDLEVAGPVIHKGVGGEDGYSGFSMRHPESGEVAETELDAVLRARGVDRVTVVGLALDVCVKATALDAASKGYATIVRADLSAAVNLAPDDGELAVAELRAAGVVVQSGEQP